MPFVATSATWIDPMSEKELTEKLATYTDAQDIQIMKVMEE